MEIDELLGNGGADEDIPSPDLVQVILSDVFQGFAVKREFVLGQ